MPSSTPRLLGNFTWNVPLLGTTDSAETDGIKPWGPQPMGTPFGPLTHAYSTYTDRGDPGHREGVSCSSLWMGSPESELKFCTLWVPPCDLATKAADVQGMLGAGIRQW